MSFWVAAAVVGGAVIGAVGTRQAGKAAAKGQERASDTLAAAAARAREEIIPRFEQARIAQRQGFGGALNLLGQTPEQVTAPFQQGNVLAQEQIGRGLGQVQNAILGSPIDLSGFQARSVPTPPPLEIPQLPGQPAPSQMPPQQPGAGFRPPTAPGKQQLIDSFQGGFRLPPRTAVRPF